MLEVILAGLFRGVIFFLFFILILFQFFYLFWGIVIGIKNKKEKNEKIFSWHNNKVSVLIPVYNSETVIGSCLRSVLEKNSRFVQEVIIILDHCTDKTELVVEFYRKEFERQGIAIKIKHLIGEKRGKTQALKEGDRYVKKEYVLLLDADIILETDAVGKLLGFHTRNKSLYSTFKLFPYKKEKLSLVEKIIHTDRIYRQNLLQEVRKKFGCVNFPGGCCLVSLRKYRERIADSFLEDLVASYRAFELGEEVHFLSEVLGYEQERKSIRGLISQRTRWTIGNIENLSLFLTTIIKGKIGITKKFVITSYSIMWYLQHYVIVFSLISFVARKNFFYLLPFFLYFFQVLLSNLTVKKKYRIDILGALAHCVAFPFLIFWALCRALSEIVKRKKLFFYNKNLFQRI